MRGEAEAYAVEAKGRADAEQMAKKADAFQHYKEGAMVDMLLEKLPLVRWCICNAFFLVLAIQKNIALHCNNRNLARDNPAWSKKQLNAVYVDVLH